MLTAARKFSLGENALEPGDDITPEMLKGIPEGKVETLKTIHYIRETTDAELEARVAALEEQVAALTKPRRKAA